MIHNKPDLKIIKALKADTINSYRPTILNSIIINGQIELIDKIDDVEIWFINNLTEDDYKDLVNLTYEFTASQSKSIHDINVLKAFKKNPELYYNYYKDEMTELIGKIGYLYVARYIDEQKQLRKRCYFDGCKA